MTLQRINDLIPGVTSNGAVPMFGRNLDYAASLDAVDRSVSHACLGSQLSQREAGERPACRDQPALPKLHIIRIHELNNTTRPWRGDIIALSYG